MTAPAKRWLKPTEVADVLGIARGSVYRLITRRKLPVARVGGVVRVDGDELLRRLEAQSKAK
jgi:excisionase family DNA binding protein